VLRDRVIQRCNRRLEEIFGYGPGELVGKSTQVLYPGNHAWEDVVRRTDAMLAETGSFNGEDVYRRRDGALIWCQTVGSLINPNVPQQGTICLFDDVSEKKQVADALKVSLREQTLIFDRVPIGIMYVRDRTILRCNPHFEAIFGYPPGALVGQSTRVLFADEQAWIDTGVRVYSALREQAVIDLDVDYRRRDGSPLICHVIGCMLDSGDPAAGTIWLTQDITASRATEAALRNSIREQQLIFDNALIGIAYQRGRIILRCNCRLEEMYGYAPGDLLNQSTRLLFATDEEWEEAGRRVYQSDASRQTFDGEFLCRKRDGSPIWVHVSGRTVDVADGSVTWIWTHEDVTARHAAEEALAKNVREYALIFDNAMIGIAYSRDRVFLRCNRRFEEIFGFVPGTAVGQSSRALFASDEEFETIGRRMHEASARGENFSDEILYRRQDGEPIWVRARGQPIQDADGRVWIWTMQDVTGRRKAEEALRRSYSELEQRVTERTAELSRQVHFMEQLIEAIPGPVFYKDRMGRYLGFNQRYLDFMGKPRSDLVGATVYDIAPKDLADRYRAADEELFNHPGHQVYETQVQAASGERREVMFQKATFANPDGSVGGIIGVMFDISERKRMEARLQQAATVFDSSAEGITITAPDGSIIAVNRAFSEITGYSENEVLGRNPRMLQSGRQSPEFYREMWEIIARDGRWQGELWNKRKDGRLVPEWLTISAVKDAAGGVIHYVGVFSDITEIKRANELLDHQAHHDHLTGLPNRLLLEDRLRGAVLRAQREQAQVAVLFVDLDRFKNINDSLGHHVGDRVLCEVANRFRAITRESDTVARLGGDEFLIVMEGIHDAAMVSRIADKILDDLRTNPLALEQEFFVGASIGISLFPQDGADAATLMRNADAAMYRAKERGRNAYEFFTGDLTQFSLARFKMETALRHAIERGELLVYLQPQFSLTTGERLGAEVLVRWQHPQLGLVAPGNFIPLAEESGLIVALGEWVQQTACRRWAEWAYAGLNPVVLSINVSGVEFRRGRIEDTLRKVLAASGLPPELLELEITESAIMTQAEHSIEVLHRLRAMGISLAIDDFGTGYSSLAYLKRLPLNKLKVDQSFIRDLPDDAEDCAIVRAVIALGHSLQLKVIAEGVETPEQREFLSAEGCDEIQGYLVGRPMPAEDFRRDFLAA
jgi:diguanylate cyclase (GGDEF)-like protein/PAS domain S-box-containing protein